MIKIRKRKLHRFLPERLFFVAGIVILFGLFTLQTVDAAEKPKKIELILDASGSMNGRLKSGEKKIDAAKEAVKKLLEEISSQDILAFRAYGHTSSRQKKDCKDTELLVDFAPVSENKSKVLSISKELKAQGYTPITYVLKLAAEDFHAKGDEERIVILVSDGRETCKGDPCATAKALAEAGLSRLVIHTVGLGVDDATKKQLECISSVTNGNYYGASSADELAAALDTASKIEPVQKTETITIIKKKKNVPGRLEIVHPNIHGHDVIDAETGKKVGRISNSNASIKLKAGIYNVKIGATLWKSVEVKPGETTVLKPGWLTVDNASIGGIDILDAETNVKQGYVSNTRNSIALMPGFYHIVFGKAVWPIEIKEGEEKLLQPGVVEVKNGGVQFIKIYDEKGEEVAHVSNSLNWAPLPPGKYSIEIDGEKYDFTLKEGETKLFKLE